MPQKLPGGVFMYRALYRKYRPLVFNDVIGQEHVVNTVRNQIIGGKISHAYMFTGTRGTGKTTCAKILARAVNCERSVDGDPCNECETCKSILNGSLMDVIEIDAASNNGVDNIRELREDVIFTPAMAKYKVYIIDEVHMLSTQAFNALLKTLEEPPAHVIFVFATTEINKVPQTILSRCQRFDFRRITVDDIIGRLKFVAQQENLSLDDNAAHLIARLADGAMRDALSVLDRCIIGDSNITLKTVEQTVGLCPYEEISVALNAIAEEDTETILEFYADCRKNSKDSVSLFSELCSYLRDMIVVKLTKDPVSFLSYEKERLDNISAVAEKYTLEKIIRSISILQSGIYDISKYKDKHIMAEITLIKLTKPKIGGDYDDLNARLSKIEVLGVAPVTATAVKPKKTSTSSDEKPKSKPKTVHQGEKCEFWGKVLEILPLIGGISICSILKGTEPRIENDTLLIPCSVDSFAYTILSKSNSLDLLRAAIEKATGTSYNVRLIQEQTSFDNKNDDEFSELLNSASDILDKE